MLFQNYKCEGALKMQVFLFWHLPKEHLWMLKKGVIKLLHLLVFHYSLTSKRISVKPKWKFWVHHCFRSSFPILFLPFSKHLQLPSFILNFIIWFLYSFGYFICKRYLWQISLAVSLMLQYVCSGKIWIVLYGEDGERNLPDGSLLEKTQFGGKGRRQLPVLWPVKSR